MVTKTKAAKKEPPAPVEKPKTAPTNLRRLVEVRLAVLGLKAADLCRSPGVDFSDKQFYSWLAKGEDHMTVSTLRKLAASLQCSAASLLADPGTIPDELTRRPMVAAG